MINKMEIKPTSVLELKTRDPHFIGYVDVSSTGVQGVWLGGSPVNSKHKIIDIFSDNSLTVA